jgi:hypothetical protein
MTILELVRIGMTVQIEQWPDDEPVSNALADLPWRAMCRAAGGATPDCYEAASQLDSITADARKADVWKTTLSCWLADHPAESFDSETVAIPGQPGTREIPGLRKQGTDKPDVWGEAIDAPLRESFQELAAKWRFLREHLTDPWMPRSDLCPPHWLDYREPAEKRYIALTVDLLARCGATRDTGELAPGVDADLGQRLADAARPFLRDLASATRQPERVSSSVHQADVDALRAALAAWDEAKGE